VEAVIKEYLPHVMFFGVIAGFLLLVIILFIMLERRRRFEDFQKSFLDLSIAVESLVMKLSPLVDAEIRAQDRTKECPQCRKRIDDAYGVCPFCSHEFAKKYFVSIMGPADEKALDLAAQKLAEALKTEYPQMKHRLRMGFDYAIADHAKRREFMTAVEKMGCTVKETVKWV
jgi:hypothetical protein